jgi:hypothetical protein
VIFGINNNFLESIIDKKLTFNSFGDFPILSKKFSECATRRSEEIPEKSFSFKISKIADQISILIIFLYHTFVNIPALLLKKTPWLLIRAGILTKV